ncbi:drug/metabolite transporter (DMT)-like permease [Natronocella acetinitrilica]|uniref:Drug/metabolite transporter (DMT)-like permease n=1 Tax=Natronocella acetinitrilica TaxID=414046 RepID=A0AAE3G0H0_9GAMM|nr:DMT family transporter [Natronocella acetinitrilica]MCP1673089.1 drug/metabolite transporter (DMT)-like permease [Natronocella acetinitrilica]
MQAVTVNEKLLLGIAMTMMAGALLASMDALGKHLSQYYPVLQVVWARYFFHAALVLLALSARHGLSFVRTRHPWIQTIRGLMLITVTGLLYLALIRVPLADATAIMFFAPVLVTLLSGIFLSERITPVRVGAVMAGFAGVLLIVRPGFETDWFMLLPLGAACTLAVYLLLTRTLSGRDPTRTTIFYTTAMGTVALTLMMPLVWQMPGVGHLLLMVIMGALGATGHFLIISAFAHAPASVLSPFLYFQIISAMVISVAVFGDPLTATMLAGTLLLIGGGLAVWWRESRP